MSNSMYSNIDSDDIFASAMEEAEIVENPFVQGGDGEPLHALDAAKRLLGNDEEDGLEDQSFNYDSGNNMMGSQASSSNSGIGGNSLLERIQQQKKQQYSTVPAGNNNNNNSFQNTGSGQFGYPIVQEGTYSTSGQSNVHIPQYSQVPAPSAYNTDSPYPGSSSDGQGSTDYKDQMMSILSVVGSAAGTVANGAYQGTKYLYAKMASKSNNNSGLSNNTGGMAEMDYQRESLLMDPHELEDRAASSSAPPAFAATPPGMRAGVITHNSGNENKFVTFVKQFVVDLKDLYINASPRVQIGVIVLFIFIIWLIFFE